MRLGFDKLPLVYYYTLHLDVNTPLMCFFFQFTSTRQKYACPRQTLNDKLTIIFKTICITLLLSLSSLVV